MYFCPKSLCNERSYARHARYFAAGPRDIGEGAPKEGKLSRQDHTETSAATFHSLQKDWQQKGRRMFWIVIDRLVGNTELRPSSQWFTAA